MISPLIGVTGPASGGFAAWFFIKRALRAAGAKPLRLTPRSGAPAVRLDGLVLGGGADINPRLYLGPAPADIPAAEMKASRLVAALRALSSKRYFSRWDSERDEFEMRLLRAAVNEGSPVLGICRGEQLLNVFFGGTLHSDLRDYYVEEPEIRSVLAKKTVLLDPSSKLRAIMGVDRLRVNSLHHQAIDRLGHGLRISARDRNRIVQAIEHPELPFVLGVQWHPEFLPHFSSQRALFFAFVGQAAEVLKRR